MTSSSSSRRPPSMSHGRCALNRASSTPPARVPASPAPWPPSPKTGAGQMALRRGPWRVPGVPTTCIPRTHHRVGESPGILPRCTSRRARRDGPGARTCGETHACSDPGSRVPCRGTVPTSRRRGVWRGVGLTTRRVMLGRRFSRARACSAISFTRPRRSCAPPVASARDGRSVTGPGGFPAL